MCVYCMIFVISVYYFVQYALAGFTTFLRQLFELTFYIWVNVTLIRLKVSIFVLNVYIHKYSSAFGMILCLCLCTVLFDRLPKFTLKKRTRVNSMLSDQRLTASHEVTQTVQKSIYIFVRNTFFFKLNLMQIILTLKPSLGKNIFDFIIRFLMNT